MKKLLWAFILLGILALVLIFPGTAGAAPLLPNGIADGIQVYFDGAHGEAEWDDAADLITLKAKDNNAVFTLSMVSPSTQSPANIVVSRPSGSPATNVELILAGLNMSTTAANAIEFDGNITNATIALSPGSTNKVAGRGSVIVTAGTASLTINGEGTLEVTGGTKGIEAGTIDIFGSTVKAT